MNWTSANLLKFVAEYETLYGVHCMTFNVHIVQHLIESVRKSGPLWVSSTFPFENNIYTLKNRINGPKSIEQQMTKKSLIALKYRLRQVKNNISEDARQFCSRIFSSTKSIQNAVEAGSVTFFGPDATNIFESNVNKKFERCIYENCVYSSVQYTRSKKWNDSVVYLKNGNFAQIEEIYLTQNGTCFFAVKQLIGEPFYVGNTLIPHIFKVVKNTEHPPVSISDIFSKAVALEFTDRQYVCRIPSVIEAQ